MARNPQKNGPQSPAHQSTRSTSADRFEAGGRPIITGAQADTPNGLDLSLCTYNCRGLARDEILHLLFEEKSKISCDILGLCETRRKEELIATWNENGDGIFLGKGEGRTNRGGIGFVVSKKWVPSIVSCQLHSARIGTLIVKLNEVSTLKVIQVYAPTSESEDEEVEDFYESLRAVEKEKSTYMVIMGDFNAKLGKGLPDEKFVGPYGSNERNDRGERLATMAETLGYYVGNSWFRKKASRRWTWISPNAATKNEIDFILTSEKGILRDVGVVPLFNTGSDHRLLRAKMHLKKRTIIRKLQKAGKPRTDIDTEQMVKEVEARNWDLKGNINTDYQSFISQLNFVVAKSEIKQPNKAQRRISDLSRQLLQKRRQMKREKKSNLEYSVLCKQIRTQLKEDFRAYREKRLLEAVEKGKSLKKCKRGMTLHRRNIIALKNENGERINTREEMEGICKKFYSHLFASKIDIEPPALQMSNEKPPTVTISEIRNALSSMEDGKAPGNDGISVKALKSGGLHLWKALAERFSRYISCCEVPDAWRESKTILLFKRAIMKTLKTTAQSASYLMCTSCSQRLLQTELREN